MDIVSLYFRAVISAADIVGESRCVMCGAKGSVFCPSHFSFFMEKSRRFSDEHWWFWHYDGKARDIILDIKRHKRFRLAYTLGVYVGQYLIKEDLVGLFHYVAYVPHHFTEFSKSMFSFPFFLALGISDVTSKPVVHLFNKLKPHSQHKLSAKERIKSLKNVYTINRSVSKVLDAILIVDDIITTGATLTTLKKLVERESKAQVYTITLAKTPKWSDVI